MNFLEHESKNWIFDVFSKKKNSKNWAFLKNTTQTTELFFSIWFDFSIWLEEFNPSFYHDSKTLLFSKKKKLKEFDFYDSQTWTFFLFCFSKNDSKNWSLFLNYDSQNDFFFLKYEYDPQKFCFQYDSQNWTFFGEYDFVFLTLNLFFFEYDSKNWNSLIRLRGLNFFSLIWLKELNLFLSMTLRIELFQIWLKEMNFVFKYDSKNCFFF